MKKLLISILILFLFTSCQSELTAVFDSTFERNPCSVNPLLSPTWFTENSLYLYWSINAFLIPEKILSENTPQFILEKWCESSLDFVPVDTAKYPYISMQADEYTLCGALFDCKNNLDETVRYRIKSIYKSVIGYSNECKGLISIAPPYKITTSFEANISTLHVGIYSNTLLPYNSTTDKWYVRKGLKVFVRKYNSGDQFKLIGTVLTATNNTYYSYNVTGLDDYEQGETYEFGVATFSETKISEYKTFTWTYPKVQ